MLDSVAVMIMLLSIVVPMVVTSSLVLGPSVGKVGVSTGTEKETLPVPDGIWTVSLHGLG